MDSDMQELVLRQITGLAVNEDQSVLRFTTDKGDVTYLAEGDCCSQSWFADITGVNALLNGTVWAVETIGTDGYNVKDGRCRQEQDSAYGYKITTDKGRASVVFRCSSNGYYGGWLRLYGGEIIGAMTPITDDWTA